MTHCQDKIDQTRESLQAQNFKKHKYFQTAIVVHVLSNAKYVANLQLNLTCIGLAPPEHFSVEVTECGIEYLYGSFSFLGRSNKCFNV